MPPRLVRSASMRCRNNNGLVNLKRIRTTTLLFLGTVLPRQVSQGLVMKTKTKECVVVLKGGFSEEREVSLASGAAIAGGLRAAGYEVTEVDVTSPGFVLPEGCSAVFIALHGTYGEDGGVQQRLDDLGVPYTGSGVEASRRAFDKLLSEQCLREAGIPVPASEVCRRGDCPALNLPVVVKPPRQGSSVGCSLVFDAAALQPALDEAWRYDDEALVQQYIPGREFTVGVIGDDVLPVVEIIPESGWYDYAAKYRAGTTRYQVPAQLDEASSQRMAEFTVRTFQALGARGFGRVDFRMTPEQEMYVLELNTIPGFTASSLLPKAAAAAGIDFPQLCERILLTAPLP